MFGFTHISFRAKLGISVAIFTVLLTSFSLYYFYRKIQAIVWKDTQDKLLAIGSLGSYLFDEGMKHDLQLLKQKVFAKFQIPEDIQSLPEGETINSLREEEIQSLQSSPEFTRIVQLLRKIKEATRKDFVKTNF